MTRSIEQQRRGTPRSRPARQADQTAQPAAPGTGAAQVPSARRPVPGVPRHRDRSSAATQALTADGRVAIDTPQPFGLDQPQGRAASTTCAASTTARPSTRIARRSCCSRPPAPPQRLLRRVGFAGTRTPARLPGPDTVWTAEAGATLTPADAGDADLGQRQGPDLHPHHRGRRQLHVHRHGRRSRTRARAPVTLSPYAADLALTTRRRRLGYYILHEGLIGVLGDERPAGDHLQRPSRTDRASHRSTVTDGWLGITDKYWAAALVPDRKAQLRGALLGRHDRRAKTLPDRLSARRGHRRAGRDRHGRRRSCSPAPRKCSVDRRLRERRSASTASTC